MAKVKVLPKSEEPSLLETLLQRKQQLEQERDEYVRQANQAVAAYAGRLAELDGLIQMLQAPAEEPAPPEEEAT